MSNNSTFTYDDIQKEAESFSKLYRNNHNVPDLPSEDDLKKYRNILDNKYSKIKLKVETHINKFESEGGHGLEHLEWVSTLAGYIAYNKCNERKIPNEKKNKIIENTLLAGLFHDIERHRGFGEDHMIEGAKTTSRILEESGIDNQKVVTVVRNHDHLDFEPGSDVELRIVFGSVFDADHFRYGLEREDTFWRMKEKKGKSPKEVIHDYNFLPPFRNAWKTKYGKKVGPSIIDFGLSVAIHIEKTFENQN